MLKLHLAVLVSLKHTKQPGNQWEHNCYVNYFVLRDGYFIVNEGLWLTFFTKAVFPTFQIF